MMLDTYVAIEIKNVSISFSQGASETNVLRDVSYSFVQGVGYAIVGQSGSGKSSLLHILGLLDKPSSGSVLLCGQDVHNMSDLEITMARNSEIGFVYQAYNILYDFTPIENVALPLLIAGLPKREAFFKSEEMLCMVGLKDKLAVSCRKMSGGEQQRVAIARAIVNGPKIIIADEPTGNLDPKTGDHIFEVLLEIVKRNGASLIMATHNLSMADRLDHKITIYNKGFI